MNALLDSLCSAIATAEGYFSPGSLPQRNNNPGDLRSAPWCKIAHVVGGFWVADSPQEGIAGLYHQVALGIARGESLRQLILIWAPPSDGNNTENYIAETKRRTGIKDENVPLWTYLEIERVA